MHQRIHNIESQITSVDEVNQLNLQSICFENTIIQKFLKENFPLQVNKSIYSPFQLGYFQSRYLVMNIDGVRLSKFKLIRYIISHNLIPVEKTTAYKVQAYVSFGLVPIDCTWTDLSKHGRKSLLTSQELM